MALISWLGQYDGRGVIPFWWDLAVVAGLSVAVYAFAMRVRLSDDRACAYIDELSDEDEAEREALAGA